MQNCPGSIRLRHGYAVRVIPVEPNCQPASPRENARSRSSFHLAAGCGTQRQRESVVGVPVEKEGSIEPIVGQFLAALDGPSSWPPPQVLDRRESLIAILVVISVLAILASTGLLVIRRIRGRKAAT
jgi:hypothetical protein